MSGNHISHFDVDNSATYLHFSDVRFHDLYIRYYQNCTEGMKASFCMPEEIKMGGSWKARSRVECAYTCVESVGCTRVWFNVSEGLCYDLNLVHKWPY